MSKFPDSPDRDQIMAKLLGHEQLLRSLCTTPEARNTLAQQLMQLAEDVDKDGRSNFRDAVMALAEKMDESK